MEPKFQQIVLPSLWPRKRTTREHGAGNPEDTSAILDDGDGIHNNTSLSEPIAGATATGSSFSQGGADSSAPRRPPLFAGAMGLHPSSAELLRT